MIREYYFGYIWNILLSYLDNIVGKYLRNYSIAKYFVGIGIICDIEYGNHNSSAIVL